MDCPHCGESIDRGLANRHPYVWPLTIISMLMPLVALVLGLVYASRKDVIERDLGVQLLWVFVIEVVVLPILIIGVLAIVLPQS